MTDTKIGARRWRWGITAAALGTLGAVAGISAACSSEAGSDTPALVEEAGVAEAAVTDTAPPPAEDAGDDGAFGEVSTTYPAYDASLPQVRNLGGPVMHDFTAVPVVFDGDPDGAGVHDFLVKYAASAEWTQQVKEYGVGTMTIGAPIVLTEAAPTSLTFEQTMAWLRGKLDGTHPEFGPTDTERLRATVFVLVFPQTTTFFGRGNAESCKVITGYHSVARAALDGGVPEAGADAAVDASLDADAGPMGVADDAPVVFTMNANCPSVPELTLTTTIAHELVEAATDPFASFPSALGGGPAYFDVDLEHGLWHTAFGGGETADICHLTGNFWAPPSIGSKIARSWSNAAAAAVHEPCVPAPPDEPYFNATVVGTDKMTLVPGGPATNGVTVKVGEPRTFDVLFFSDRATDPWEVGVKEVLTRSGNTPVLTLELDRTQGQNGQKVHVTLTAKGMTPNRTTGFQILSKLGTKRNVWYTPVAIHN